MNAVDPVLYSFDNAPLSDEPETDEERAEFDAAVEDIRSGRMPTSSGAEVHAKVQRAVQAMARFGAAGERDDITLGDVLRWLDTGEASPEIAALLAGEHQGAE